MVSFIPLASDSLCQCHTDLCSTTSIRSR